MLDPFDDLESLLQRLRPLGEGVEIERRLISLQRQAEIDPAIRRQLIEDPAALLRQHGLTLPRDAKITVHEESEDCCICVLPIEEGAASELSVEAAAVLRRAREDPTFEALLLRDPVAAIFSEFGFRFPAGVDLEIYRNRVGDFHVVLARECAEGELSDLELEMIAGGRANPFRRRSGR